MKDRLKIILKYEIQGVYRKISIFGITFSFFSRRLAERLMADLEKVHNENDSLNNLVVLLENEGKLYQSEIADLQHERGLHQSEIADLQHERGLHQSEISALQHEKGLHQSEIAALQHERGLHQSEIANLRNERTFQKNEISDLRRDWESFRNEISSLQSDIAMQRHENDKKQDEVVFLQSERETQRSEIMTLRLERESFLNSIVALQTEKAALHDIVESKKDFAPYRSWSGGFEIWQKYYREKYSSIEQKSDELKRGLDKKSHEAIDLMIERNFNVFPQQKYMDCFLVNHSGLLTLGEYMGPPYDERSASDIREKYHFPEKYYPEVSIFAHHSGLTLLPENVRSTIDGRDVIDGGALCGDSSLMFCLYSPRRVFAFEPMPQSYNDLCDVIEANKKADIIMPVKMGLGSEIGESKLFCYDGAIMSANMAGISHSKKALTMVTETPMTITTIDEYAGEHNLDVALIKLDIEGNEYEAINGAIETIKRLRPILLISLYHTPKDFFEIKPLLEDLSLGYKFMVRKLSLTEYEIVTELTLIAYAED